MTSEPFHPVLVFDGLCVFCNKWANFIIRHDRKKKFRFTPLQSEAGRELLRQYPDSSVPDSVLLICHDKVHQKSSALLHIFKQLGGFYSLLYAFIVVPAFIRDYFYDLIAGRRYKWWGKREACMIPSDEIKERFIF